MPEPTSFRRINQALGKQPKIGPFPAGQLVPFAIILFLSWSAKEVFHLSWLNAALFAAWLMGTSWILTGTRAWRFFSKFIATPYFVRAAVRYESLLRGQEAEGRGQRRQGRQGEQGEQGKQGELVKEGRETQ